MKTIDWTVGKKLGLAFGAVLALLAGVVLFSSLQLNRLQASSEFLRSDGLRKSSLARSAQLAARTQVTALNSLFVLDDPKARVPVYPQLDHQKDLLINALDQLRTATNDPREQAIIDGVFDARAAFEKAFLSTVNEIELDQQSAKMLMINETEPKLQQLEHCLDQLVALQDSRVEQEVASNREAGILARRLICAFGLLAILIAALSALTITRSIVRPLTGAVQFADAIAQGNLETSLPKKGQGELKTLLLSLDRMRDGILARENRIGTLAYFDGLTGLSNRTRFRQQLLESLGTLTEQDALCILLMNLSRFKSVNDALGYEAGDALLKEVGHRVDGIVTLAGGLVARQQADEFSILLPGRNAIPVASAILAAMAAPVDVAGQPVDLEAAIGIAIAPDHGLEPERLLLCADQAMQAAKRANSGPVVYDPAHAKDGKGNLSLLGELRHAIACDELVLFYQPQLDLRNDTVPRAEVLVRWQHPQRGLVPPDSFIPFAEQTGVIRQISHWVLEHACRQLKVWQQEGMRIELCVNLSARDLTDPGFPEFVGGLLLQHAIPSQMLALEVTESAAMEDPAQGLQALERLRQLGLRLSIDDFGTGYSSLAYLKGLPVQEIKIDKSFVLHMDDDADDHKIVRSTIDLGHIMDLEVIAEGVETGQSLQHLRDYGCDFAQGYFVSRPLPAEKFSAWLTERRAS